MALGPVWLLVPVLPVALWIAWSDLSSMRISNRAVLVVTGLFLLFGPLALPLDVWAWRFVHLAVVLALGFVAHAAGLMGGGDAKYAAAMAPYFALSDLRLVLLLFAAMLLGAFVSHRIAARIPPLRRATAHWASWQAGKDFPMGLALSGTLIAYLALAVLR